MRQDAEIVLKLPEIFRNADWEEMAPILKAAIDILDERNKYEEDSYLTGYEEGFAGWEKCYDLLDIDYYDMGYEDGIGDRERI